MKYAYFANRNRKEILRDPLSMVLGIAMPAFFILLFSIISKNAPIPVFKPTSIVPGMTVFGFSFMTMFLALLIAKDKNTSLLSRLFISPLTIGDFIVGYTLPMLPIALLIGVCCTLVGCLIGVPITINLLFTLLSYLPYVLFATFMGIFLGIVFNEASVMVIGNIYIILGALLGGSWMDLSILGRHIEGVANALPFSHAIRLSRTVLAGSTENLANDLVVVGAYTLLLFVLAALAFRTRMKSDKT